MRPRPSLLALALLTLIPAGCAQLGDLGRGAGLANLGIVALCPKEQLEVAILVDENGQLGTPTLGCVDPVVPAGCPVGKKFVGVVIQGDETIKPICQ